jgi:hypothetical protein
MGRALYWSWPAVVAALPYFDANARVVLLFECASGAAQYFSSPAILILNAAVLPGAELSLRKA